MSAVRDEEGGPGGGDEGVGRRTGRSTGLPETVARSLPPGLRLPHTDGEEHQESVDLTNDRVRIAHTFIHQVYKIDVRKKLTCISVYLKCRINVILKTIVACRFESMQTVSKLARTT